MSELTVGLLSPGEMGHVVGNVLVKNGVRVLSFLEGRSGRTKALAEKVGIGAAPSLESLVGEADLFLSILVPAEAQKTAELVADALKKTRTQLLYVDCNAIAPDTVRSIGEVIEQAGGRFVDAGIIGPPPREPGSTRFYTSGKDAEQFAVLNRHGLDVRVIGDEIGQASGLKMTYAALTKGFAALSIELLVAAKRMGLYGSLLDEFKISQAQRYQTMEKTLTIIPSRARRWVGEMEEIASTFEALGLTPKTYQGVADVYRFVSRSPLADESPESWDKSRTLEQMIEALTEIL